MKGLKEFIEDLAKDNRLREKFKDLKDVKEIVKFAKKEGYEFTEDEYMDKQLENVSGGVHYIDSPPPTPPPSCTSFEEWLHGGRQRLNEWQEKVYNPWLKRNDLEIRSPEKNGPTP